MGFDGHAGVFCCQLPRPVKGTRFAKGPNPIQFLRLVTLEPPVTLVVGGSKPRKKQAVSSDGIF